MLNNMGMSENGNIYFVTDTHFGLPPDSKARETEFVAWLDSIKSDAGKLFLLGDVFDFWFTYKHVVPKGFVRVLGKLAELADQGVEIHYFTGNHDMWIFDYFAEEMNFVMHSEPAEFQFGEKRFLVGHGDGLTKQNRGYMCLKKMFASRFCQRLFAALHPWAGFSIACGWSRSSRKKHFRKPEPYRGKDVEEIPVFCQRKLKETHFDYFVFGHRHLLVDEQLAENSRYINLGEWITMRNYGVFDGEKFEIRSFG